jgi:homoserine kinase
VEVTSGLAQHGVRVTVPATSSNVGPGLDSLALALALRDVIIARETTSDAVTVRVFGEGAGVVPADGANLVAQSMRAAFDVLGRRPRGLSIECHNRIPHERGLGSSAAAAVAGILAARALVPGGAAIMNDADVLALATDIEGYADNPAACLLGGLAITWSGANGQEATNVIPMPEIRPVVYVPRTTVSRKESRSVLPSSVPYDDAVHNVRSTALLVHAFTAAPDLLLAATEDRLHQPFRAPAQPATAALISSLRGAGIAAVVSGAGPSVLALSTGSWPAPAPPDWEVWRLDTDLAGASVENV